MVARGGGQVGLGWLFRLASLPGFSKAAELAYKLVSKNRQSMGGALDAGLLAMGRINMEKEGTGSCTDPEGECRNSPILDKSGTCAHPPAARDHLGTRTDQQPRRACSHLRHVRSCLHTHSHESAPCPLPPAVPR